MNELPLTPLKRTQPVIMTDSESNNCMLCLKTLHPQARFGLSVGIAPRSLLEERTEFSKVCSCAWRSHA